MPTPPPEHRPVDGWDESQIPLAPRSQFARAFRRTDPPPDTGAAPGTTLPDAPPRRGRPDRPPRDAEQEERERKVRRVIEDDAKRARIEAGEDHRQPPEYRGHVFEHADADGVHPTAFPPLRWGPQEPLSDEFIKTGCRLLQHPESAT
jgi:hypothetical protein